MNEKPTMAEKVRSWIGIVVTAFGILGVTAIAITVMRSAEADKKSQTAQLLLTSVLPLVGTWVGTVLAYYFARENYESAARNTKELIGLDEKLSAPVASAMISIAQAAKLDLKPGEDPEKLLLSSLVNTMTTARRNRLPVLDMKGAAVYIIHLSTITDFLSQQALKTSTPANVPNLTIADLKAQRPDLLQWIAAWTTVKRTATLADAKQAMEAVAHCSDVFVTEAGRRDEAVVGWITNVEIALRSRAT